MDTKQTIAAFDFDGTITTKDTLFDFIAFYHGRLGLWLGFFILSPALVLFKAKIISNEKAKEIMLSYFFKKQKISCFLEKCDKYKIRINNIVAKEAKEKILWHQQQGHTVAIVSASIDLWIKPWAKDLNIEVISTKMDVRNGFITGKLGSKNCHGQEKVNRLLSEYPHRDQYTLYAYGDSRGDYELLKLADYAFYRRF